MLKSYKYRLYPTDEQKVLLAKHFGCSRWVYNWGLQTKDTAYKEGKKLSCIDLTNLLPEIKSQPETQWLQEVNSQALQMALRNLNSAYERFFKKQAGHPNFKRKYDRNQSFQCPENVKITDNQLFLPKFKTGIRVVIHREFQGKIKTVTVSRNCAGHYYVSVLTENTIPYPEKKKPENPMGIDLGQRHFAILSDGTKIENPRFLQRKLVRLAALQQCLSRKTKNSQNYRKIRLKIARLHVGVSNTRKDFHHKLSHRLTHENQVLCVEDLDVKGLLQKEDSDSRGIGDVGWSQFLSFLEYKSEWYGTHFVRIGRYEPSTKTCNSCGYVNTVPRTATEFVCRCGYNQDRDIGAAVNIRNIGFQNLAKDIGIVSPKVTRPQEKTLTARLEAHEIYSWE